MTRRSPFLHGNRHFFKLLRGKKTPVLHLETATEAAHLTENVPILHIKVKEENRFCSLYTEPLLVSV